MNSNELLRRAGELEELARGMLDHARRLRSESSSLDLKHMHLPERAGCLDVIADALIAARRQRLHHFDGTLFNEPAWDMLLFLYRTSKSGSCATVDQVCRSSGAYGSTARRWLAILVDQGLVVIRDNETCDLLRPAQLTEIGEITMTNALVEFRDTFLNLIRRICSSVAHDG